MKLLKIGDINYWITGNKKFLLFKIDEFIPGLNQTAEEIKEEIFKNTTTTQITIRVKSHWEAKEIIKVLEKHYISSETVISWDWIVKKKVWIDPKDNKDYFPGYEENRVKAILHKVCFKSFLEAMSELSKKGYKSMFLEDSNIIIKSWDKK